MFPPSYYKLAARFLSREIKLMVFFVTYEFKKLFGLVLRAATQLRHSLLFIEIKSYVFVLLFCLGTLITYI